MNQPLHELIRDLEQPILVKDEVDGRIYKVGTPDWSGYSGSKCLETGTINHVLGYYSTQYTLISSGKKEFL